MAIETPESIIFTIVVIAVITGIIAWKTIIERLDSNDDLRKRHRITIDEQARHIETLYARIERLSSNQAINETKIEQQEKRITGDTDSTIWTREELDKFVQGIKDGSITVSSWGRTGGKTATFAPTKADAGDIAYEFKLQQVKTQLRLTQDSNETLREQYEGVKAMNARLDNSLRECEQERDEIGERLQSAMKVIGEKNNSIDSLIDVTKERNELDGKFKQQGAVIKELREQIARLDEALQDKENELATGNKVTPDIVLKLQDQRDKAIKERDETRKYSAVIRGVDCWFENDLEMRACVSAVEGIVEELQRTRDQRDDLKEQLKTARGENVDVIKTSKRPRIPSRITRWSKNETISKGQIRQHNRKVYEAERDINGTLAYPDSEHPASAWKHIGDIIGGEPSPHGEMGTRTPYRVTYHDEEVKPDEGA